MMMMMMMMMMIMMTLMTTNHEVLWCKCTVVESWLVFRCSLADTCTLRNVTRLRSFYVVYSLVT